LSDLEQWARLIISQLDEPGRVTLELGPGSRGVVVWMAARQWVSYEETAAGVLLVRRGPIHPTPTHVSPQPSPPDGYPKMADALAAESRTRLGPLAIGIGVALIALALLFPLWRSGSLLRQSGDVADAGASHP
jgi:hypothetical protein